MLNPSIHQTRLKRVRNAIETTYQEMEELFGDKHLCDEWCRYNRDHKLLSDFIHSSTPKDLVSIKLLNSRLHNSVYNRAMEGVDITTEQFMLRLNDRCEILSHRIALLLTTQGDEPRNTDAINRIRKKYSKYTDYLVECQVLQNKVIEHKQQKLKRTRK